MDWSCRYWPSPTRSTPRSASRPDPSLNAEARPLDAPHDQQFRAAFITSLALHIGLTAILVIGPMVWPRLAPRPEFIPLSIITPPTEPPAAAAPAPEPVEDEPEPEPEEEPDPVPEPVVSEPETVPESIEDVRRRQEEEAERQRLEEQRRERERQEEERRRREAEEEARRRAEEERRRQPQKAARSSRSQPQEARRSGIDLTSAEDDRSTFTVEDFPFADYLLRIRDKISNEWNPPAAGAYSPRRRVEVFFRIARNGDLVVTPRVENASGNSLYDRAALQAIAQAAPFPPLPTQYQGQSLGVGLAFVQE